MITFFITLVNIFLLYRNDQITKKLNLLIEKHDNLVDELNIRIDDINDKFKLADDNFKLHDNILQVLNKKMNTTMKIEVRTCLEKEKETPTPILDIDSILDKIIEQGIDSLTELEKKYLNENGF